MENIISKDRCCGCHACLNICPKNAISMKEDIKGFKYPVIDKKKCIDCSLCKKVCPVLNSKKEQKKKIKAYACYNTNLEERLASSSGGIFILLAKEIIRKKGVVFGALFDNNFSVKHSYTENEKDLNKFMGSKYIQSTIGDSYKKVREFLENDRYVLFSGTPCQIEGLKAYLKKDYNKLYTQDIICHGVPSPKVWKKYLEYQKNKTKENIKSISFRNKDNGWLLYRIKIMFNKKSYSKEHSNDLFMKIFLSDICLRDSCYNCQFKKKYRESDITLADYWGINKEHPKINDDKGISLVVVNSLKGNELFENIKNSIKYSETDLEKAIKYNPSFIKSSNYHKNEGDFINDINAMSLDKLVNKYIPKISLSKRIIIKLKKIIKKTLKKN